ncbi:hypothetical protein RHMOL_Rhmol01G0087400 [Rhododendron molle]|uniref:Uncharacterized protein n=1 Tax=Rhododendron molle TaxID=49168 RepID=A0ACC0PZ62_RHOML|nr:hypothetical protein RHMOL_Rhmol01G0087400 [Rhododendron molle]
MGKAEINTVADSSPPEGGFVKERLDPVVGKSGGFLDDFTPPNPPYLFSDHLFSFLKSRLTKREKREKRGGRRSTLVTPPVDRRLQLSLVFLLSRAEVWFWTPFVIDLVVFDVCCVMVGLGL